MNPTLPSQYPISCVVSKAKVIGTMPVVFWLPLHDANGDSVAERLKNRIVRQGGVDLGVFTTTAILLLPRIERSRPPVIFLQPGWARGFCFSLFGDSQFFQSSLQLYDVLSSSGLYLKRVSYTIMGSTFSMQGFFIRPGIAFAGKEPRGCILEVQYAACTSVRTSFPLVVEFAKTKLHVEQSAIDFAHACCRELIAMRPRILLGIQLAAGFEFPLTSEVPELAAGPAWEPERWLPAFQDGADTAGTAGFADSVAGSAIEPEEEAISDGGGSKLSDVEWDQEDMEEDAPAPESGTPAAAAAGAAKEPVRELQSDGAGVAMVVEAGPVAARTEVAAAAADASAPAASSAAAAVTASATASAAGDVGKQPNDVTPAKALDLHRRVAFAESGAFYLLFLKEKLFKIA